jgi:lambda repressor-like predicted transcriptional regulator
LKKMTTSWHKVNNRELSEFLAEQCAQKKLSFRGLSIKAGLSPGTVHNIISGKFKPNVKSLNSLADFLGLKREFVWQKAGLLEDMDYSDGTTFNDPQVKFHFAIVDKLPLKKRKVVLDVLEALITSLENVIADEVEAPIPVKKTARNRKSGKNHYAD